MNKKAVIKGFAIVLLFLIPIAILSFSSFINGDGTGTTTNNTKTYDPATKEAVITNSSGSELGNIKLVNYTNGFCFVGDCYVYYQLTQLSKDIAYNGSYYTKDNRKSDSIEFYNSTASYDVPVYKQVCELFDNKTSGKLENNCSWVENGKETKYGLWQIYDYSRPPLIGTYLLREKVNVGAGETVDLIPNFYGIDITEWVLFTGMTKYEWYTVNNDNSGWIAKDEFDAQIFQVGATGTNASFTVQGVSIMVNDAYSNGAGNVGIWIYDSPDNTTCGTTRIAYKSLSFDFTNGASAWYNFTLDFNGTLYKGRTYCLIVNSTDWPAGSGGTFWNEDRSSSTYPGGDAIDAGSPVSGHDYMFEIWGVLLADTTFPQINITTPLNLTYAINISNLNYTYSDNAPDSCWYSKNSGKTNTTKVVAGVNWSFVTSIEGNNNWTLYCNDTANNVNTSIVSFFKDTILPQIKIVYPASNWTNTTETKYNINYTISDVNLNKCWWTDDRGITNTTITCGNNLTAITWGEGINNVTIYTNDTANNINASSITFILDTIFPQVNIISPTNTTYNINISNLNYTYMDLNEDSCWYSRNGGGLNSSKVVAGNNFTFVTSVEGNNTYTLYCNDSVNHLNVSSINFMKDTTIPNNSYHIFPSNNTLTVNNTIIFRFNATDGTQLKNATIFVWNISGGGSEFGSYGYVINTTNITGTYAQANLSITFSADGVYRWSVQIFDIGGNQNWTDIGKEQNWTLSIDDTPPYFTTIPANTTITYTQGFSVDFEGADTGSNFDNYKINWTTSFSINKTGWLQNTTKLGVGTYLINVSINDTLNNINYTIYKVIVNKATTTLGLTATTPITYGTATDFVAGETGCNAEITCSLNLTDIIFQAGNIWANYSTPGNANYTGSSAVFDVVINKALPNIVSTVTSPITYGATSDFTCSGTNSGADDLTFGLNQSNKVYPAGTTNMNCSTNGGVNYTSASTIKSLTINQASSQTLLTFDKTSPQVYGIAITPTCSIVIGVGTSALTNGTSGVTETLGFGNWSFNCSLATSQNYTSSSNQSYFNITQATGNVTAYINNSRSNFTTDTRYSNNTWLNGTLINGLGNIELWLNGSLINNGTSPINNFTNLSVGYYNLTSLYRGNSNFSSFMESWLVNVTDIAPPVVNTIGPPDNITRETPIAFTLTYNVTSVINIDNCSLLLDGGPILTSFNVSTTQQVQFVYPFINPGNFAWSVSCTDANNQKANSSILHIITVVPTQPPKEDDNSNGWLRNLPPADIVDTPVNNTENPVIIPSNNTNYLQKIVSEVKSGNKQYIVLIIASFFLILMIVASRNKNKKNRPIK